MAISKYISDFFSFLNDLIKSRALVWELAKQDFRAQYLGSYLGLVWAFVNPTVTILIFWFVFAFGFKSTPVANVPYILWFVTGMVPWFFFSGCVSSTTTSVIEKSFLVQKVVFRVSILPLVKIISAFLIHCFFVVIIFIMFLIYGYMPQLHYVQILYYLTALLVLLIGIAWITSSLIIFFRDIGQIVAMVLQFGFWLTPVFWSVTMLPEKYQLLMKLNPLYYIIEGYRDSFINHIWFWEHWRWALYYWSITSVVFIIGAVLFRRLRPHFSDVL